MLTARSTIRAMFMEVDGRSTYLERRGSGRPVVLVHALGMSVRSWDPVAERLARAAEVIAYDYRGHGRTEKGIAGTCAIPELTDDLAALLARLGLGQVLVVGLAVGAMIAQQLAVEHPGAVAALVLASPRSELDGPGAAYNAERAATVEARGMRAVLDATIARAFPPEYARRHPDRLQAFRGEFLANDPHGYAAVCRGLGTFCLTPRLREIACPTLLLPGEVDRLCPPEQARAMQARIPGARCETLTGVGHFSAIEAPASFAERCLAFVSTLRDRPA
jgi:3-oxoadipate enol-lactonase